MTTALPQNLQDISPSWLSTALSGNSSVIQVTAVSVASAHEGTTGRALIDISYAHDYGLPPQMFVKLPPTDATQREFVISTGMGKCETMFYQQLASNCGVRVPHCYYAGASDDGSEYIMLLENLEASGCTFQNASKNYSMKYISSVLDGFSELHGKFYNSPRFSQDLAWLEPPMAHAMGPILVKKALDTHRHEMPSLFSQLGDLYVDQSVAIHKLWCEGVPTLVHGDVHDGNLFSDHGIAGFLDWAIVSRATPMRDIANFMNGSIKPDDLAEQRDALLGDYHQKLERVSGQTVYFDNLWQQYRWHGLYTWVAATTTLAMGSEWQPIGYTQKTLERLHRALADNQTLGAIKESL